MRRASLLKFSLDMDSGVFVRDEHLTSRDGYIVKLEEDKKIGYGEIAPLPGFSEETLEQVFVQAQEMLIQWLDNKALDYTHAYASVAFGISMAQAELEDRIPHQITYESVVLCSGDPDDVMKHLENVTPKVAKEKVGLYEPIRDALTTKTLLQSLPDLHLRLDANRSWNEKKAAYFVKYLPLELRKRILFFEEPCKTVELSIKFAQENQFKLAWDESLREALLNQDEDRVNFLLQCDEANTIVIKPSITGSLDRCLALVQSAQQYGKEVVISSSFETSFGLSQLSRLAKWLTPETLPGLDTLRFFAEQLEVKWPGFNTNKYIKFEELEISWFKNAL